VGPHDASAELVVDPSLSVAYATFLGGSGADSAATLAVDASGKIYVGGATTSTVTFPEGSGARVGPADGTSELFVAKIDPTVSGANSLVYLTFLGGSGTTGNPKGVLYSHRSISLHSSASLMTDALGLSRRDRALVVVPMFHANAWGIPHAAALCGADLVLPDRFLQAEPLAELIESERPTVMGCVPPIFADLLRYASEHEVDLSSLNNAACGGSAVPKQLMRDFQERHGVRIFQAWGMTETSPVATYSRPAATETLEDDYWEARAKQGKPLPWVELRLVDDDGREVPWDGQSTGEIQVRGPWVAASYYNDDSEERKFDSGWLCTGDIASVDEHAFVQITDRSKDVIKSGGEWISSVELENELMAHSDVLEAAVIAKPDERWDARPLCCVVLREGSQTSAQELVEHLRGRVAKWWLPDEFAFIDEVPKTSVGKFDKKVLRAQLAEEALEGRVRVS